MNLGNRHSQHSFAQIPSVNAPRSKFDRSFPVKDTFNFDYLVPIFIDEILPGDTCNLNVKSFIRLAPQAVPVLDNMYIDYFFFFVPNRLVWDNWEKLNGAQDDPGDSVEYLVPQVEGPTGGLGYEVGSIFDKMGLPTEVSNCNVNALPFRAYNLIWNEWFRDQNLQDRVTVNKGDGPDAYTDYALLKRAKKHDYFTSGLPWPQKGAAISLPIGGNAPIILNPDLAPMDPGVVVHDNLTGNPYLNQNPLGLKTSGGGGLQTTNGSEPGLFFDPNGTLVADLAESTAITVNQLRLGIMTQSLLELDARGGTRYVEILKAHFNVISPDFRLQRPEFLSGGTTHINQHPVPQTSETTETSPQGKLAAFSTATTSSNIGFSKSFVEHGFVIGLAQARADVTYQQGLNRMWSRRTRYDYFWPKLQELGEQEVLNKEIYFQGTSADDEVNCYQERYADYRYRPGEIRGQFRSTFAESLDVWHLAEEFESLPSLNAAFIESNTPIERILEVPDGYPALLADYFFDYKHARPMVTYGVPATLGRF